jgi:hypothetical protein
VTRKPRLFSVSSRVGEVDNYRSPFWIYVSHLQIICEFSLS